MSTGAVGTRPRLSDGKNVAKNRQFLMCSTVYLCAAQQATVVQYVEIIQACSETLNNLPTE